MRCCMMIKILHNGRPWQSIPIKGIWYIEWENLTSAYTRPIANSLHFLPLTNNFLFWTNRNTHPGLAGNGLWWHSHALVHPLYHQSVFIPKCRKLTKWKGNNQHFTQIMIQHQEVISEMRRSFLDDSTPPM